MPSRYSPDKRTLGNLLSLTNPPILVPDWQRNYSWTTSEVETFWNDLLRFSGAYPDDNINNQEYFLGSVVIVDNGTAHLLLDGQQRLATAAILLSVIRDFLKRSSRDAGTRVQTRYLSDFDDARDETSYKVTLNTYDRDFFKREILEPRDAGFVPPAPTIESHNLVRRAREFFHGKFEQEFAGYQSPEDAHRWALRVLTVLTNHMSVVAVLSEDEDNAASVFETLNDRGIGLSTPDLLRNLVLRRANDADRDEIIALWGEVLEIEGEASLRTFLRHYWVSHYGDVKTQSLYREIKARLVADNISSLEFSRSLRDSAVVYSNLVSAQDDDPETAGYLADIGALGAGLLYPAVMSAYEVGDPEAVRNFVHSLVAAFVRHSVIGRLENSRLEDRIYRVARELRASRDFGAAIAALEAFAPTDEEFARAFRTQSITRRDTARYVLRELELARRTTEELTVAPPSKVHVEHIYPQTPRAEDRLPNHTSVVDRIGNLTLLDRRLNAAARNTAFPEKKQHYERSEIRLTRDLLGNDEWTADMINARQETLSRLAPGIWAVRRDDGGTGG
jgi:uncharacterized protein DUF262/uncharacterized protein DUF1524